MPTHGTFDVEISLAKGIIFRKISLANGAILKPWAAHPCPKFSREPPPPWAEGGIAILDGIAAPQGVLFYTTRYTSAAFFMRQGKGVEIFRTPPSLP